MDMRQKTFYWLDQVEIIQDAMRLKCGYKDAKIFMVRTIFNRQCEMITKKGHQNFHEYANAVAELTDHFKMEVIMDLYRHVQSTFLKEKDPEWRQQCKNLKNDGYYDDRNGWR